MKHSFFRVWFWNTVLYFMGFKNNNFFQKERSLTVVTETPLLLTSCYSAGLGWRLTGAVHITNGSRPLSQVTTGERLSGDLKLMERQQRILGKEMVHL